jgi:hypothetical protein
LVFPFVSPSATADLTGRGFFSSGKLSLAASEAYENGITYLAHHR